MTKRIAAVCLTMFFISHTTAYAYSGILFSHVKAATQIFKAEYVSEEAEPEEVPEPETPGSPSADDTELVSIIDENDVTDEPEIVQEEVVEALIDTPVVEDSTALAEDGAEIIESEELQDEEKEPPMPLDMSVVEDTIDDSTPLVAINTEEDINIEGLLQEP